MSPLENIPVRYKVDGHWEVPGYGRMSSDDFAAMLKAVTDAEYIGELKRIDTDQARSPSAAPVQS